MYGKRPKPDEIRETDVVDQVRAFCNEWAQVKGSYGGLEISVLNNDEFPWADVFELLAAAGQDVWIRRGKEGLVIRSKPPNM